MTSTPRLTFTPMWFVRNGIWTTRSNDLLEFVKNLRWPETPSRKLGRSKTMVLSVTVERVLGSETPQSNC